MNYALKFIIILTIDFGRRQSSGDFPKKVAYDNTCRDDEVTYNVMYNTEFPDEPKYTEVNPNDLKGTYNYVVSDTDYFTKDKAAPKKYNNLQSDSSGVNYTLDEFDTDPHVVVNTEQAEYNNAHLCDDDRAYDSITNDTTTKMQIEKYSSTDK